MIVVVPGDTPVTRPVASTVPIPGALDTHGLTNAAVPLPESAVVPPTGMVRTPVIDALLTVTVTGMRKVPGQTP